MKRYALLMSMVLCGIALAFEDKANVSGSTVNIAYVRVLFQQALDRVCHSLTVVKHSAGKPACQPKL